MNEYPRFSSRPAGQTRKSGWGSKLRMFLITSGVVFIIISFFWGEFGFIRMYYLSKKIDSLKHDIAVLKVQHNDLLWETEKITNDPNYIQRYAIEKYGYARPEQKIIQFVPADSSAQGTVRNIAAPRIPIRK